MDCAPLAISHQLVPPLELDIKQYRSIRRRSRLWFRCRLIGRSRRRQGGRTLRWHDTLCWGRYRWLATTNVLHIDIPNFNRPIAHINVIWMLPNEWNASCLGNGIEKGRGCFRRCFRDECIVYKNKSVTVVAKFKTSNGNQLDMTIVRSPRENFVSRTLLQYCM